MLSKMALEAAQLLLAAALLLAAVGVPWLAAARIAELQSAHPIVRRLERAGCSSGPLWGRDGIASTR